MVLNAVHKTECFRFSVCLQSAAERRSQQEDQRCRESDGPRCFTDWKSCWYVHSVSAHMSCVSVWQTFNILSLCFHSISWWRKDRPVCDDRPIEFQCCHPGPPGAVWTCTQLLGWRLLPCYRRPPQKTHFGFTTSTLVVRQTPINFGDRALSASGSRVWNNLFQILLYSRFGQLMKTFFVWAVGPQRNVYLFNCACSCLFVYLMHEKSLLMSMSQLYLGTWLGYHVFCSIKIQNSVVLLAHAIFPVKLAAVKLTCLWLMTFFCVSSSTNLKF